MNKGFAIWREPGSCPVGIAGAFQEASIADIDIEHGFVFKPWSHDEPSYYLTGEQINDEPLLRRWASLPVSDLTMDALAPMDVEEWQRYIQAIQQEIVRSGVQKVVAARSILVKADVGLFDAFLVACSRYPDAFVSIVYHENHGVWLGATPEILVQPERDDWETVSMAGTLLEDTANWTGKELEENTTTQQYLEQVLHRMGAHIKETSQPDAIRAGALRHLVRRYRFSLAAKDIGKLIAELHPTPAVGGFPRGKALSMIAEYEMHGRGLFAGYLGFFKGHKPYLWVNLRCCRWYGTRAMLYAGAGINAMSRAEAELAETAAKMATIGSCL